MKNLLLLSLLVLFGCSKEDNTELIDSYTSQISSLNSQLSQLNSLLTQSQYQITSLQSQVNSISGLEATIDNLNSDLSDYQTQITNLQAQITELENNPVTETVVETVTVLVQDNSTIEALQATIAELNNTIASLQAQITSLENNQSTSTDTTSATDNWPDYHAQGHTMEAVSIWRLTTRLNASVPESERFNIKIYPDALNPNKLLTQGINQSGFMDIGNDTGIPFVYIWGNVGGASIATGNFQIDSSLITGVSSNYTANYEIYWFPSTAAEDETPNDYLRLSIPPEFYDEGVDNTDFNNLVFYRID